MSVAKYNRTGKKEKDFRKLCYETGDNVAVLTSEIRFSYIDERDVETVREYGWSEKDVERMVENNEADELTRLAAWIRECGEVDHGMVIEDDPYFGYPLDEDGNYAETPTSEVV
jgi:hypothetical protein